MRYEFGDFTLDTGRHELLRAGAPIKLRPKVFQVLAYLVEHRDRMVPKDELLETIWPRVVGEAVLNSCVMAARKAVGDDGRAQGVIKTMHGLGFRFVAPVRPADAAAKAEPQPAGDPAPTPPADPLPPPPDPPAAGPPVRPAPRDRSAGLGTEHKTVTVLACAVAEAEQIAQRIGAEAMHAMMQGFFDHARAVMDRYEGTIVQWWGDGFVALFGAPRAHEDDGRRAVLAALEINRPPEDAALPEAGRTAEQGYGASIGLHTGPVVVGALQDSQFARPYTARGETTDIATRLQADASPGRVLLSEATYRLVETEIDVEPAADGGPYRLLGATRRRGGVPRRLQGTRSRFVGRNEELAILQDRLARAEQDSGQVISVIGAPGIGKSRLLDEFREGLGADTATVLKGHCLPYGRETPFMPLIDMVRDLCAIADTDGPDRIAEKVRAHLDGGESPEFAEALLLELLGVPIDRAILRPLSPQARRTRTFALLNALVFDAAAIRPVMMMVEDLHWIDATSEEWLDGFVARLGDAAILLLVTYRPPYNPGWLGRSSATQLALPPLTAADSTALVRSMLDRDGVADDVADDIVARGDGNPFFLEELTQTFDEADGDQGAASIPDTVQAVLSSRIDRLDRAHKQLLQMCAVIGARIPHALLQHVAELDADMLEAGLDHLQAAGFLLRSREARMRLYRFRHALTQDVAYQSLLRGSREALHARLADILERDFADIVDGHPEVLARHHTEAGHAEAAIGYWQRAGRAAYERSAHVEAIGYASRGLDVLATAPDDGDRAATELSLQLTLAPALMAARGYGAPEVEQACNRARALCEHIGDERQMFRALVGLWNFYWVRGELSTARDVAGQLLGLAERANDPVREIRAHAAMGEILFHTGELAESHRHLQRGVALYESVPKHSFATQTPQVACLCYAAWASWHLGHGDRSLDHAADAVALADELAHPLSRALSRTLKAELHQFRLEIGACRDLAEQAVDVCREQQLPFWEGSAKVILGWAQAMGGDFDLGHRTLEDGLAIFAKTGARVQHSPWLGMLAEIHSQAGRVEDGLRFVEEALSWVDRTGEQHYHAELWRLRGELLLGMGAHSDAKEAEQAFTKSLEIARRQGAVLRELRAAMSLAGLQRQQRRSEEARALLKPLLARHADLDCADMRHARTLLHSFS